MTSIKKQVGQRIRTKRQSIQLSGEDIYQKTGISTGNLSAIENGKVLPSATALIKLSAILKCSTDYILFGNNEIKSHKNSNFKEHEENLIKLFYQLDKSEQEEIFSYIKFKISQKNL